jgi:hypothetical protein
MASGHANRANRPNTWLHRPATQREVLTCQPGAVHTWHKADIEREVQEVRFYFENGHSLGRVATSGYRHGRQKPKLQIKTVASPGFEPACISRVCNQQGIRFAVTCLRFPDRPQIFPA